jgi:hypothetical protein
MLAIYIRGVVEALMLLGLMLAVETPRRRNAQADGRRVDGADVADHRARLARWVWSALRSMALLIFGGSDGWDVQRTRTQQSGAQSMARHRRSPA